MTRILVLVLFASMRCAGWATQGQSQTPQFSPAPGSPVTVGPGSGNIITGDLNGDGHLDLVTGHIQSRIVTVQLGDGAGRFAPAPNGLIALNYMPGHIQLGDLNGDKILDLGVTISDRDNVDIFLGNGKGSFSRAPGSPFTASASEEFYTRSIHFVDINEDGKLDIITANGRKNTFATLIGNGRGGFSPGQTMKLDLDPGQGRIVFACGDVDGDGHLDAVAVSGAGADLGPGRVVVQRGDGKGAFKNASGPALSVPPGAFCLELADMNGDQRLDIVISHGSNDVSVLLNNGKGVFAPAPGSPYNLGTEGWELAVGDVNRDGKKDLVVATVESVTVLLCNGRGFVPAPGSPFHAGPGSYHLAVGDVNGDGKLDVAAASFGGNAVTVLLGR